MWKKLWESLDAHKKFDIGWCDKLIINKIIISISNENQSKFANPIGGKKKYIYIYILPNFLSTYHYSKSYLLVLLWKQLLSSSGLVEHVYKLIGIVSESSVHEVNPQPVSHNGSIS